MSVTVTIVKRDISLGNRRMVVASLAMDADYPTDGEPIAASMFGLQRLDALLVASPTVAGYHLAYVRTDGSSGKLKAFTGVPAHTHVFAGDALAAHGHNVPIKKVLAADGLFAVYWDDAQHTLCALNNAGDDNEATSATSGGTPAGTNANNAAAVETEAADHENLAGVTGILVVAIG